MNLSLVLLTGEKLRFNVNKDSCVIGRSAQCDVVIPHEAMSRKHCLLEVKNGEIFVTDLGSSNGVSIEGQKIPANQPVAYHSYFALSFGAVQSVAITLDEVEAPAQAAEPTSPTLSQIPRTDKNKTKPSISTHKPKAIPKAVPSKVVKIIIVSLILALVGYLFLEQQATEAPPTPAQIYE